MTRHHPIRVMYCQKRSCTNADGMEVTWYPDSIDGPGWPYRDTCPLCDSDLGMDPLSEEGEEA